MTKQEKVRGWIAARLEIAYNAGLSKKPCNTNEMSRQAVNQLHSQGVVIKVEKRLPDIGVVYFHEYVAKMLKAGFVAVEPLIEEQPGYKETFDVFLRSLIHMNKVSKMLTQKEVDLLWDLLERWESKT